MFYHVLQIRLPEPLSKRLRAYTESERCSMNYAVITALEQYLDQIEATEQTMEKEYN